nr:hypothetical protein Hi04_10k_c4711_00023 [uncultured bacterium]
MSVQNVTNIVSKAMRDRAFRDQLFSKPEQALKGYDLTPEEAKGLTAISRAEFDKIAAQLEEKILSQAVGGGVGAVGDASHAQATGQALKQLNLGTWGAYCNCY